MMLNKDQKIRFVEAAIKELQSYRTVGVVNLSSVPDRLLQSAKNSMRSEARFIIGRKSLLLRILESNESTKKLASQLSGTSAIILSNEDPFELNAKFKAKSIMLEAKPGQVATSDVEIKGGETSMQPGQAVTDLKSAGIDVQIQKGKVIIASDKVVVNKGDSISLQVAKALHMLGVKPFTAMIAPIAIMSNGIMFGSNALSITKETTLANIYEAFAKALALSFSANIINAYTISSMVSKAYSGAVALGVSANIYANGITDKLIEKAVSQAKALGSAGGGNA